MDYSQDEAIEVVQEYEITDDENDDDGFEYKSVGESDFSDDDDSEDFLTAKRTLDSAKLKKSLSQDIASTDNTEGGAGAAGSESFQVVTEIKPSAIDDFIRNFLLKMGMMESLDKFNTEWYELQSKKMVNSEGTSDEVPDVYLQNQKLEMDLKLMGEEVEKYKKIAEQAQSTWSKFRKERDFHRTSHQRVVQEKKRLVVDIKRLKKHYEGFEPAHKLLKKKYDSALKEKMLMKLERDRLRAKTHSLQTTIETMGEGQQDLVANSTSSVASSKRMGSKAKAAARAVSWICQLNCALCSCLVFLFF